MIVENQIRNSHLFRRIVFQNINSPRISIGIRHSRHFSSSKYFNADIRKVSDLDLRITPEYSIASSYPLSNLIWNSPPRNVFFVKKPWDNYVRGVLIDLIKHVSKEYPDMNIILEPDVCDEVNDQVECPLYTGTGDEVCDRTDLLVTLGGDGTILNATSMFSNHQVPPVVSFSLGTLGFLLPFDVKDAHKVFKDVYTSQSHVMNRSRLACTTIRSQANSPKTSITHAMNDINIHRAEDPHLTVLDLEVDGQHVTQTTADGVIISTPTGSTAYSLSAGGSIVHPSVSCILITPICPRSLSFRPLIFPGNSRIKVSMNGRSRGRASQLSIDGVDSGAFQEGDSLIVEAEKGNNTGIWCVAKTSADWVHNINGLLGFNSTFGGLQSRH